jgi:hypothetical protein
MRTLRNKVVYSNNDRLHFSFSSELSYFGAPLRCLPAGSQTLTRQTIRNLLQRLYSLSRIEVHGSGTTPRTTPRKYVAIGRLNGDSGNYTGRSRLPELFDKSH